MIALISETERCRHVDFWPHKGMKTRQIHMMLTKKETSIFFLHGVSLFPLSISPKILIWRSPLLTVREIEWLIISFFF